MHQRYYGQKIEFIDLTQDDEDDLIDEVRRLREEVQDLMVWNLGK